MGIKHGLKQKQMMKEMVKPPRHTIRGNCLQTPGQKILYGIKQKTSVMRTTVRPYGGTEAALYGVSICLFRTQCQPGNENPCSCYLLSPSGRAKTPLLSQHIRVCGSVTLLWKAALSGLQPRTHQQDIFRFTLLSL